MKKFIQKLIATVLVAIMFIFSAPLSDFIGTNRSLFEIKANAVMEKHLSYSIENYYFADSPDGFYGECAVITGYSTAHYFGDFVIPDTLGGYPVKVIEENAFLGCDTLTSVEIPDSVLAIYYAAFKECSNLKSVKISESVISLGGEVFQDCTSLTSIEIPNGLTSLSAHLFYNCSNLRNVSISDSVTDIWTGTFGGCNNLKNVYYAGSESEWNSIYIAEDNYNLLNATKIFNAYNTDLPNADNNANDVHNYISTYDEHNHFDECIFCGDTINIKTHKFDNDCDASCDCGYIRTDAHDYQTMYDEQSHFEQCTICGDVKNFRSHKYEDDLGERCNCGYVNHDYVWVIDKLNDCGTNGVKHEKCRICDTTRNENTVILATGNHTYTNSCDTDCNVCGDLRTIMHSFKLHTIKATTSKDGEIVGICSGCGKFTDNIEVIKQVNDFKLSTTDYIYNGKVKTPTVTVKDSAGKTLEQDTDYTVTYSSGRKNVGTYKVIITLKGNYSGSKTLSFKINPISILKCEISLSQTSYTYDGKSKTPSVIVLNHYGTKLTDSSYITTYAKGRKNVGAYKVTVKMKGNYSGSKTLYFNILPSKTSKITPTCSTTEIKASWKSVTGASGYKVELLNSKGKVVKSVTTTKTSYTFKKLSKVTTYKIRVTAYKTIDKKAAYSGISTTITTSTAPAKVTLSKVTAGSKSATPAWKTVSGASGYQVQYSTSSKFKSAKTSTVSKGSSKKATIKKLTKGKKYYFKVRAYKTVGSVKVYGTWSAVKSVKVK